MTIHILTLFPEFFQSPLNESIIKRAKGKNLLKINLINIRDFATDKHKSVDSKPYGGGRGMLMRVDVIVKALESIKPKPYAILLDTRGKTYDQKTARSFAKKKDIAIICGHYEGADARVEKFVDEVISIGNFVLTGGEPAALILIDSITHLTPGAIHPGSLENESFDKEDTLEYPQYTEPREFNGLKVPEVLLSGNHANITKWRKNESTKAANRKKLISNT